MILSVQNGGQFEPLSRIQQWVVTGGAAWRLLLAAVLGGIIGVDREWDHKPSGVRTNLLICFGAALFTFLSPIIAGEGSANKAQIASNIVQGIGFLGAGLILHNRDRVSGLTSAATVWAVASIGMACGGGLYGPAIMAAGSVIPVLGGGAILEREANLKSYTVVYETRGTNAEQMKLALLAAMDHEKRRLTDLEDDSVGSLHRLSFPGAETPRVHKRARGGL